MPTTTTQNAKNKWRKRTYYTLLKGTAAWTMRSTMSLKTMSADRGLSFLHMMKTKNLHVFQAKETPFFPIGMTGFAAIVSYCRLVRSHSTGHLTVPLSYQLHSLMGPGMPQQDIAKYTAEGSSPQSPAHTQEQLAPPRTTTIGHTNSHLLPKIQFGLGRKQIGSMGTLTLTHEGKNR